MSGIRSPQCSTCLDGQPYAGCPGLKTCALMAGMEHERDELLAALRVWMKYFGGDHETAVLAIVEDGSTLTEAQEKTRALLAKHPPKVAG